MLRNSNGAMKTTVDSAVRPRCSRDWIISAPHKSIGNPQGDSFRNTPVTFLDDVLAVFAVIFVLLIILHVWSVTSYGHRTVGMYSSQSMGLRTTIVDCCLGIAGRPQ